MFKQLRYPYQISKTSLVAVGTPHTWPALLATVMWLIELLGYDEAVAAANAQSLDDPDPEDPNASEKAFYSYLGSAYQLFLSGDDEAYERLEHDFLNSFEVKNNSIRNQIQSMEERNLSLEREIAEVEERRAHLPELLNKKNDYVKDMEKFKSLIQQLKKHKEQLESKAKDRQAELMKLEGVMVSLQDEIENIRQTIATQGSSFFQKFTSNFSWISIELSPDDVRRMMEEKERIETALQSTVDSKTQLQKRVWEAEDKLRESVQLLDESGRRYNTIAEDLKLVPKSAHNAAGRDFSIEIDIRLWG